MKQRNISEFLDKIKENPYKEIVVKAPHCGYVEFVVTQKGVPVSGPEGKYKEKPGTLLAYIVRENNKKPIFALENGAISEIFPLKNKEFVQAGTPLLKIRHYLTKQEVIDLILQKTLYLVKAQEKGKYYFVPEIDKKIGTKGCQSVLLRPGEEILILNVMKREKYISYEGPKGLIYAIYFKQGQTLDCGDILFGVCPQEDLESIKEVIVKVQSEWEEVRIG
ncbi:MAG: biotin attachment protein [Desulfonauticus sp.]|nr:biotin attachment protein [Desulfonauticus sp.]